MVNVFISYAMADAEYVRRIHDSLERLQHINPIVVEWISTPGINLVEKVREGLKQSKCTVALITSNSQNEVWMNQEVGFATAQNKLIIPIKEEMAQVKGFLEGIEYIKFEPHNFLYNISDVIDRIIEEYRVRNFFAVCPKCRNKNLCPLSDRDELLGEEKLMYYNCEACGVPFGVDSVTLIENIEHGMS